MTGQTKSPEGAGKAHEKMKPVRLHFFCAFHNAPWLAATVAASSAHTTHGAKVCVEKPFNASFAALLKFSVCFAHFRAPKRAAHLRCPKLSPPKSSNHAQFVKIAKEITKFCQKKIEKCRKIFAKRIIFNYNKKYSRCYYQFVHQNLIQSNIRERER